MYKDGILCRTEYEALELQENTRKLHGHEKTYDLIQGYELLLNAFHLFNVIKRYKILND